MPARSASYVAPFAVFLALLALGPHLGLSDRTDALVRAVILVAALAIFSRGVISFRLSHWLGSVALGVAVFAIWIAPDTLIPGWHQHWLFSNRITGTLSPVVPAASTDPGWLVLRAFRAVILVPIIEELFWRGWLPRWIDHPSDFREVPLGSLSPMAFWITALFFASEHGALWDVGLVAGVLYNWWMIRTRSLGSLFLAHAVTNACLSAYVVIQGKWQYW